MKLKKVIIQSVLIDTKCMKKTNDIKRYASLFIEA